MTLTIPLPHYPEGPVPTKENTPFDEWNRQFNAALGSIDLFALQCEAKEFYECGVTPKGAASQIARECGREI